MGTELIVAAVALAIMIPIVLRAVRRIRSGKPAEDRGIGYLSPPSPPDIGL